MAKKRTGFTLIELLVVIAIIGTLSGIVLVSMSGARSKARDATRKSDMKQTSSAQEMHYGDDEVYHSAAAQSTGIPEITPYLRALHDPLCPAGSCSGGQSNYNWADNTAAITTCTESLFNSAAEQWFCVWAELENKGSCGTTSYFAASQYGTITVCNDEPTVTEGCTCFH